MDIEFVKGKERIKHKKGHNGEVMAQGKPVIKLIR
jgi:hypothetical protein